MTPLHPAWDPAGVDAVHDPRPGHPAPLFHPDTVTLRNWQEAMAMVRDAVLQGDVTAEWDGLAKAREWGDEDYR